MHYPVSLQPLNHSLQASTLFIFQNVNFQVGKSYSTHKILQILWFFFEETVFFAQYEASELWFLWDFLTKKCISKERVISCLVIHKTDTNTQLPRSVI